MPILYRHWVDHLFSLFYRSFAVWHPPHSYTVVQYSPFDWRTSSLQPSASPSLSARNLGSKSFHWWHFALVLRLLEYVLIRAAAIDFLQHLKSQACPFLASPKLSFPAYKLGFPDLQTHIDPLPSDLLM